MAVTANWYSKGIQGLVDGTRTFDWDTDTTIKVALLGTAYSFDPDTHIYFDDGTGTCPKAFEITGTGYTAAGIALGSPSVVYDTATNEIRLKANATQWTTATFTAYKSVIYKDTGTNPTRGYLLGFVDFGGAQTVSSGTFTITWDSTNGLLKIAAP